ncbi:MAG: ATP-dependent Clp protease ATP-binding subunit [Patescibacteria group bacterium]|jgi:ATP-dependent Clp protease ATP-binding subunit ClpC
MNNEIFKKFTPNLKKTILESERIAKARNSALSTEHQLLSLLLSKDSLAYEILSSFDVTADKIDLIASLIDHNKGALYVITEDAKKSIQLAVQYAAKYNHATIGSEHLLLSLISNKNFNSYLIIERIGVDPKKIKRQIETIFKGITKSFNQDDLPMTQIPVENMMGDGLDDGFINSGPMPFMQTGTAQAKKENALDQYSNNLTKLAKEGKLDPVIGRDKEIARIVQILSRRTKNNPILVGEPGVGKTAIVEGLAQRIVKHQVPRKLDNCQIMSLDLGSILAGTMYRGQFESRIKKILAEIEKRGNIILFVDEIHMMVGAGSTEGSIDAANLLKPMLAKGQLRLVGSTTFDEYKKHIEKDPAFERRFQPIHVLPPTVEETIQILNGLKSHYEAYHHVAYTESAIEAAARLSHRYIHDRSLPDKAIDLIDEAGASVANKNTESGKIIQLRKLLAVALKKKEKAISEENFEGAALHKEEEAKLLLEIEKANKQTEAKDSAVVDEEQIARLVSDWTGVPVVAMTKKEKKTYLNLSKTLAKFVVGQDEAITEISQSIKRSRVGISSPHRPIGSFIFLGPTGVGKTELAKVLAREVFGSSDNLFKIDMSEFMEKHNVARLIGAPAGYIGYEEGGKLTEKVRKNPYLVILFDEIEKAHPEVFNILLQIMEDGVLTDAKGRKIDFKNTIIIMTSNLGTDVLRQGSAIGFTKNDSDSQYSHLKSSILDTVEKTFRPEFINRLDKVIIFYPLKEKSLRTIVDLQAEELIERLKSGGYTLEIPNDVRDFIATKSHNPQYGARPIRKFIAEHIENMITDAILAEKYQSGDSIICQLKDDLIVLA